MTSLILVFTVSKSLSIKASAVLLIFIVIEFTSSMFDPNTFLITLSLLYTIIRQVIVTIANSAVVMEIADTACSPMM